MSRVLITRPQPDADAAAAQVSAAGHQALVHPLMRIEAASRVPVGPADALAFTSANGVRAWRAWDGIALPAWCVGPASARAAREAGLAVAGVAGGDVASLAAMIARAKPGRVLHVSGAAAAGDLSGALRIEGIRCERVVAYDAVTETTLPPAAFRDIERGADWVMLYSPRSARLLGRLAAAAGLVPAFRRTRLAALSPAVAAATALPFAHVHVAARPASSALVDIISGRDT